MINGNGINNLRVVEASNVTQVPGLLPQTNGSCNCNSNEQILLPRCFKQFSLLLTMFCIIQIGVTAAVYSSVVLPNEGAWWAGLISIIGSTCGMIALNRGYVISASVWITFGFAAAWLGILLDGGENSIVKSFAECCSTTTCYGNSDKVRELYLQTCLSQPSSFYGNGAQVPDIACAPKLSASTNIVYNCDYTKANQNIYFYWMPDGPTKNDPAFILNKYKSLIGAASGLDVFLMLFCFTVMTMTYCALCPCCCGYRAPQQEDVTRPTVVTAAPGAYPSQYPSQYPQPYPQPYYVGTVGQAQFIGPGHPDYVAGNVFDKNVPEAKVLGTWQAQPQGGGGGGGGGGYPTGYTSAQYNQAQVATATSVQQGELAPPGPMRV